MSMATKRSRMMTYLERLLTLKSHDHAITWSCEITRQTNHISNYKSLYILYQNVYGYQRWQSGDIQSGVSFHKFTRPFDHVILQGHVKY